MLVEVHVKSLRMDRSSDTPVVVLEDTEGERVLPIWIGHAEAHAIATRLADTKYPRPLTHDLLASAINALGARLNEVQISRVEANTFFAEMVCQRGDEVLTLDARPSDSVAIALRMNAKILVDDLLLGDALALDELEGADEGDEGEPDTEEPDTEEPDTEEPDTEMLSDEAAG